MPVHKLILHPIGATAATNLADRLEARLRELDVIGEAFELDACRHFTTGAAFLDGFTFLGCSPYIETEPPADRAALPDAARRGGFCHLRLAVTAAPELRANPESRVRCPSCRKSRAAAALLDAPEGYFRCEACGEGNAIEAWHWGRNAGFSNCFLEVWGIHQGEAAPTENLVQHLAEITATDWSYFYTQGP